LNFYVNARGRTIKPQHSRSRRKRAGCRSLWSTRARTSRRAASRWRITSRSSASSTANCSGAEPSKDYPATVATTWEISFRQVEKDSPAGADLLNLCAFFAPDDIPKDLIRDGAKHLPAPLAGAVTNPLTFDDAVKPLRRYSLIEAANDMLSVHRLVQAIVRDRLTEETRKQWAEAAVRLIADIFPSDSDDVRTWHECERLLPHARTVADHAEELAVAPDATGYLLNQIGLYLKERAQFSEAKRLYERAVVIGEKALPPNDADLPGRLNNLAMVLAEIGDLNGAYDYFKRVLTGSEVVLGANDPRIITILNNLGGILTEMGKPEEASRYHERALRTAETAFGPDHPKVATYLNNLGGVRMDLGDPSKAREFFQRALKIDEATYGPDHPNVAIRLNNLGMVLLDSGDLSGAKAHYERALKILRKFLGDDHPKPKTVRRNLEALEKR
jgi:Tfp pilus assembly protein PilF